MLRFISDTVEIDISLESYILLFFRSKTAILENRYKKVDTRQENRLF